MKDLFKSPIFRIFITFFFAFVFFSLSKDINKDYGFYHTSSIYIAGVLVMYAAPLAMILGELDGKDNKISHHWLRFIVRGILLILFPLMLFGFSISGLASFLFSCSIFAFVFPLEYNYVKGHSLWYVGTEANFDKMIRWINSFKFFKKLFPLWLIAAYIGCICLTYIFYTLTYKL